jgi:transposase
VPETQPMPLSENAAGPAPERSTGSVSAPTIEIRLAGAVVRVAVGTDCKLLADVLRAVRASAA